MRTNTKKLLGAVAVAGLVAASGSAFTASNTVATGQGGAGVGVISGYAVTDVLYTFADSADFGLTYATVTYTLSGTATKARARVNGTTNGTFVNCALTTDTTDSANRWTCTLTDNMKAADADELEVAAVNAAGTDVV